MKTYLYQVDKADDQIIGSITQMLDDYGFEFEHTSTRNYVEARFDFDLADEENFEEIMSELTCKNVDDMQWTYIETEFTYVFAITVVEPLNYNIS